jgi:hypothetical protein
MGYVSAQQEPITNLKPLHANYAVELVRNAAFQPPTALFAVKHKVMKLLKIIYALVVVDIS